MKINHIIDEAVSGKFLNPQATAQDPGLEREKDVDVIIFGRIPQDFTFGKVVQALEDVLPREYPPGSSPSQLGEPSSPAELKGSEIAKNNGAVVTTKPLSTAQKVVKEFQARGIKCTIDQSGLGEDITRRGFLKGAGAAAVAGGANAQSQSEIEQMISQASKELGVTEKEFYDALKNKLPGESDEAAMERIKREIIQKSRKRFDKYTPEQLGGLSVEELEAMGAVILLYAMAEDLGATDIVKRASASLGKFSRAYNNQAFINQNYSAAKQVQIPAFKKAGRMPTSAEQLVPWMNKVLPIIDNLSSAKERSKARSSELGEGTAGLPDPNNFDSDNDYRDALDAYGMPPADDWYDDAPEPDPDAWMGETKEKIGNMDADAFDAALSRMKKLAGAGPLKTVYDPEKRVYKNVPHAVQPAQQPKKAQR